VTVAREDILSPHALHYLNRLSDVLFVLARTLNAAVGAPDVLWRHQRAR
jgi:cob(I)alamin adenosyltransferase